MGAPSRILLLVSMAIMLFVEGWSLVPALRAAPSWRVGTGGRSVMAETESFSSLQRRAGLRALCMYSAVVPPDTTQDDVASASTSTSASAAAAATGTKTPMTAREARTAPARARAHTEASRQKISQANKGKVPWNVGQSHSEATKRKIAEKTREAMARRKVALAAAMDPPMSVEEYGAHKAAAKKAKAQSRRMGGLTPEGRKRISDSLKLRWSDPAYRAAYSAAMAGKRSHSEETKRRISAAIKEKWKDEAYRAKMGTSPSACTRQKISDTLKARWEDPAFRERMMRSSFERTDAWREAISRGVKAKWQDPSYQLKVRTGIDRTSLLTSRKPSTARKKSGRGGGRTKLNAGEAKRRKQEKKHETAEKESRRKQSLRAAMRASRAGTASLKELLGGEKWFEEKLRRTREGDPFIDDESLEKALGDEWLETEDGDVGGGSGCGLDGGEEEDDDELQDWEMYDEEDPSVEDVIEVYDEHGALVGTFQAREYERLRTAGRRASKGGAR